MIFVTVGTHEQPFDRLVKEIDRLKGEKLIAGDVFIQTGYSSYTPKFCEYKDFLRFEEMLRRMTEAELVITHGGTGSIMLVLYRQKIPLVMPRQKKYNEHIDDHQVLFCRTMDAKGKIIAVFETGDLGTAITKSRQRPGPLGQGLPVNVDLDVDRRAAVFAQKLNEICLELVRKK